MRRLSVLAVFLVAVCSILAQNQNGIVKTRGRMIDGKHVPGVGLPGAIVSIKGRTDVGVKNSDGSFSFPVTGNLFMLQSVSKSGYALVDADAVPKTYAHTSNPIYLVMETPDQIAQDKLASERRIRRTLQRQLQEREDEIEALKAENKISQQKYHEELQKLYADQESNEKLISEMAKRYSELDYDQMDDFYRQVSNYIEQGELTKADSLLRSRGDLKSQVEKHIKEGEVIQQEKEKIQRAELAHNYDKEELARRSYGYYESFKMQHQNDSAAYYIELRAKLDTTNIEWLNDAAQFISKYQARYNDALNYYEIGLRQAIYQYGEESEWTATMYNNIGSVYRSLGKYKKALEYGQKALSIREKILGKEHLDVAISYNDIGTIYESLGDYANALEYHQKALEIKIKLLGSEHYKVATSYNNIGNVYESIDEFTKALEYKQKALGIREKAFGNNHPIVASSYNGAGTIYLSLEEYTKALEYFYKSLDIWEDVYGNEHPNVAISNSNIGLVYKRQKDYTKALEYYHKALVIEKNVYGSEHPDVGISYNNIGSIYESIEEYEKALEYYHRSLVIMEKELGLEHPNVGTLYFNLAGVYADIGNYIMSLDYFQKTLVNWGNVYGKEHKYTQVVSRNISEVNKRILANDKDKMKEHIFIAKTASGDTPARQKGMDGEYIMLEFADWNIKDTTSLFEENKRMNGLPKSIVVMKGDIISKFNFENTIGVQFELKHVGIEEKNRIINAYETWKK